MERSPLSKMLSAALEWHKAGCSVIRVAVDGTKRPLGQWKEYQTSRADTELLTKWFDAGHPGIGIVCGKVSGYLEMLEFEARAVQENLLQVMGAACYKEDISDVWEKVVTTCVSSPSGGAHFYYRVLDGVNRNIKLAERLARDDELTVDEIERLADKGTDSRYIPRRTLVETRGEGGFVVTPPSNGKVHPSGREWRWLRGSPAAIPILTPRQRDLLHVAARSLDQPLPAEPIPVTGTSSSELLPGDDFNLRSDWQSILEPHGWRIVHRSGERAYWRRPGKSIGLSAVTGGGGNDYLYVWTTSTELPSERALSKWRAYVLLEYAGDFSRAASALRSQGYGSERPKHQALVPLTINRNSDDDFWSARAELNHCHDFAKARRAAPWAVLVNCLLRVVMVTDPFVVLPALSGGIASLNLFCVQVGKSGTGKGVAYTAAREAVNFNRMIAEVTPGSGEAIAHAYMQRNKDGSIEQHTTANLFDIPELDTLLALTQRTASTLLPELRKAWMGERLGFHYVDKFKRLPVPAHAYRMCLIAGVQPERVGWLLNDSDGGTPQRFLWVPVNDSSAPDEAPDEPSQLNWQSPIWYSDAWQPSRVTVSVCQQAKKEIDDTRLKSLRGESLGLDSHGMLNQLKVATALAIFNGATEVRLEDWQLANYFMTNISNPTRALAESTVRLKIEAENVSAGNRAGIRADASEDTQYKRTAARVKESVMRRILQSSTPVSRSDLNRSVRGPDKEHLSPVLATLVYDGLIVQEKDGRKTLYRSPSNEDRNK